MHSLTKLLIAAIAFASIQTLNAAAFFQNALGWGAAVFCWAVAALVAWRRSVTDA